jgi:hypothetical protein
MFSLFPGDISSRSLGFVKSGPGLTAPEAVGTQYCLCVPKLVPVPCQNARLSLARATAAALSVHAAVTCSAGALSRAITASTRPASSPPNPWVTASRVQAVSSTTSCTVSDRPRHSVQVLLSIYAHCIPGHDQIASQQIEQALHSSRWLPAGPQQSTQTPGIPSAMRPCHSWTQRDTAGPDTSAQIREIPVTCGNTGRRNQVHGLRPQTGGPRHPVPPTPLTRPDLAHNWPTATGDGLPNRSRTRIRPGIREHRHRV